ncbi:MULTISPECIES: Gfo/Idh/MocA family protein [Paraburkholderia]|uniref:Gfo/Idh/MocA family protein n=1 Tax=Paraburkholderia TaxID=1822464 RepID=UPI002AB7794E|nr:MULTISPECIES: Gfo/Idh/MocA family oxidoreductase [Paraburkholderia]
MSSFNVGVLGIGNIGEVCFANAKKYPIVNVPCCAGRDRTRSIAKAHRHSITRSYANADELLADADIDIVLNLTVPQARGPLTSAALRAGEHVYTKKPLRITFDEGGDIVEEANECEQTLRGMRA